MQARGRVPPPRSRPGIHMRLWGQGPERMVSDVCRLAHSRSSNIEVLRHAILSFHIHIAIQSRSLTRYVEKVPVES